MKDSKAPQITHTSTNVEGSRVAPKASTHREVQAMLLDEHRFSLAMQEMNDGLWDWDLNSDTVHYSPRCESILGYPSGQLPPDLTAWQNLIHPDDRAEVFNTINAYLQARNVPLDLDIRFKHHDGNYLFINSKIFVFPKDSELPPTHLVGTLRDVTARKRAEALIKRNTEILEMIAIGSPASEIYDAIALMYEERHPGLRCSMLELSINKLMHGGAPSLPKAYCNAVHGLEYGPSVGSCGTSTYTGHRVVVEDIDTDPKWADIKHLALPHGMRCCWSEPIKSSTGKVLGAFGMYYDHPATPNEEESHDLLSAARLAGIVMERDQTQKKIHTLAYTDELTGLASRAYFYQKIDAVIQSAMRTASRFSLLYIDLDNFKSVNDTLGHDKGDLLLKKIGLRLKEVCRRTDFVSRLSGDEFCIIVEGVDNDSIATVATNFLDAIIQPLELGSRSITPGCCIGIAHFPDDANTKEDLLKAADVALYAAKENGKNQYAFYSKELFIKAEYHAKLEKALREAIEQDQLKVAYQPIVDIQKRKIVGFEALSRWEHESLGTISPGEFIPLAEKLGLMMPLTKQVLTKACEQLFKFDQLEISPVYISVNVYPSLFIDKDFVSFIKHIVNKTGIDHHRLQLEVTENAVQTDPRNLAVFEELSTFGVRVAIDDFGIGYSSIASLKHLSVDTLKIDKYIVSDLGQAPRTHTLVSKILELAQELNYSITVEGVETMEQYATLLLMGCKYAQGFLFGGPKSPESLIDIEHMPFISS